jgi:DNA-binding transcriptional ArsR family regulator
MQSKGDSMLDPQADTLSRTFLALADPTRRAILAQIAERAQTVNALVVSNSLSQPGISKHLKVLEEAGLIRRERVAKTRPVHLEPEGLKRAGAWIDHYRQHGESPFDRMDAPISRLNEEAKKSGAE